MGNIIPARLADSDADYKKLKINKGEPEIWEDGLRTTGKKGEFEWWYFDSHFENGASLVTTFFTDSITSMKDGFEPRIEIRYTDADGFTVNEDLKSEHFHFSKEQCKVQIGKNLFEGNLHEYHIHLDGERFQGDVYLTGNVDPWRTGTGYIYYGDTDYFAWLPAVPEGKVKMVFQIDGISQELTGTGYHDHNWGNTSMINLMHHWYWGRAKIGDYQVISSYITAQKQYGYEHFPIFLLAKGKQKIGDDYTKLTYTQSDLRYDEKTKKHYYNTLCYEYTDGNDCYRITYTAQNILEQFYLVAGEDNFKGKVTRSLLKLKGLAPSYIRFAGDAVLEHYENKRLTETVSASAIWEMMEFGTDRDV